MFKNFKLATLAFVALACLSFSSAFAQNGQFISDQPSLYSLPDGAKFVNPRGDVLIIDESPSTKTVAITYKDGSVENLTFGTSGDYNTVLDRFVTGSRAQGNDFYYTNVYGSNAHRRIPYTAIRKATCAITQPGGGDFYTATITLTNGATVVSNGYSSSYCLNFN